MPAGMDMLLLVLVMFAVLYFTSIRPESKRRKAEEKMRSELVVGDVITTIGGVMGTICAVKETSVVIETGADRVRIEFAKSAVASKGKPDTESAQ